MYTFILIRITFWGPIETEGYSSFLKELILRPVLILKTRFLIRLLQGTQTCVSSVSKLFKSLFRDSFFTVVQLKIMILILSPIHKCTVFSGKKCYLFKKLFTPDSLDQIWYQVPDKVCPGVCPMLGPGCPHWTCKCYSIMVTIFYEKIFYIIP